ncbi:MAG TPA: glycosyltransferase family 39 protein [Anaerolineae bacterium]|nr:glycosyltransferase family 39 protein [Anaerolineae bacterium]
MNRQGEPRHNVRWLVAVGLSVLWLFIVYAAYYTVHKPFDAPMLLAIVDRAGDLGVCAILLLVSAALGGRVLRVEFTKATLEDLLFAVGLGLGIVSLVTLALGMVGLLNGWLFWMLLALAVAANLRNLRGILSRVRPGRAGNRHSRLSLLLLAFLGVTFVLTLFSALTPPTEWDALVYHLAGPKTYIDAGRVVYVPDNFHLSFPALTEMLFMAGMLLKGDILAHLIHLAYGVFTVAAIYAFSRKHFTDHVPLLAAALFVFIPTAAILATWAYVDLALAFYGFLAFWAVVNWLDGRANNRWLAVAGAMCGMAMSVKYTGVTALGVVLVLALVATVRARSSYRPTLVASLLMVVIAVVVASPWYLKSLVYTGNPIYPYVFGGHGWNEMRSAWLASIGVQVSPLRLLLLPWDMTVLGTQGTTAFDATISPYFLALLPLLLFVRRDHRMLLPLALSALVTYILWIAAGAVTYSTFVFRTRILLPCFAPLSVITAYVVDALKHLDRAQFSLQRFLLLAVALGLTVNLFSQGLSFLALDPLRFVVGAESREEFLSRQLADGHYEAMQYINASLPSSARILFLWEPRSYYCERHCLPDVVFDHFSQLAVQHGDAHHLTEALRGNEISHILVNERWLAMGTHEALFTAPQRHLLEELVQNHLQPVYRHDGLYTLYAVKY